MKIAASRLPERVVDGAERLYMQPIAEPQDLTLDGGEHAWFSERRDIAKNGGMIITLTEKSTAVVSEYRNGRTLYASELTFYYDKRGKLRAARGNETPNDNRPLGGREFALHALNKFLPSKRAEEQEAVLLQAERLLDRVVERQS